MIKFIYWAIGVRKTEEPTLTNNSMAKMPPTKYINFARENQSVREEFAKEKKSLKQKQQLETYYDRYNH